MLAVGQCMFVRESRIDSLLEVMIYSCAQMQRGESLFVLRQHKDANIFGVRVLACQFVVYFILADRRFCGRISINSSITTIRRTREKLFCVD